MPEATPDTASRRLPGLPARHILARGAFFAVAGAGALALDRVLGLPSEGGARTLMGWLAASGAVLYLAGALPALAEGPSWAVRVDIAFGLLLMAGIAYWDPALDIHGGHGVRELFGLLASSSFGVGMAPGLWLRGLRAAAVGATLFWTVELWLLLANSRLDVGGAGLSGTWIA